MPQATRAIAALMKQRSSRQPREALVRGTGTEVAAWAI
jgi:hypothetical protein